jgi:urocanate hydratase
MINKLSQQKIPITTPISAESPSDYVRTISALAIILDLLERKMSQIKVNDSCQEHVVVHGYIRSALSYERKVLARLTDPHGMASMTSEAMSKLLLAGPTDAIALLEANK